MCGTTNDTFDSWLKELDLEFWGTAQHKVTPAQFFEKLASGEDVVLLDVRSPQEREFVDFPFALHIPINELPDRLHEVPMDRLVAVFCSSKVRAAIGYAYLQLKGFQHARVLAATYADLMPELLPGKVRKLAQQR
ncbi:MAG: rhodanese-like domain-containing protein [Anaerolineae bacterium]